MKIRELMTVVNFSFLGARNPHPGPSFSPINSFSESENARFDVNNRLIGTEAGFVVVERYKNGMSRRYILDIDDNAADGRGSYVEEDESNHDCHDTNHALSWLPRDVKNFILPSGFPGSVSNDYLNYMLLQFPTNVTGWICSAVVTSSLLKGVGIGSVTGTTAAASAAVIRWVSKDGFGALGRLFIGGRFGGLFDDDPKQWRMYADIIGSAGSIFDLATQIFPNYFLLLASLGNLTKAVARGLKDPSFRVIQNHFVISGNLGEVSAKEEVWEVTAQLLGLALGVLILDNAGLVESFPALLLTWMPLRLLHLWLRYQSLLSLRFETINLRRARMLIQSHILDLPVEGISDCNLHENILSWEKFMKPRITYGVPLLEMIGPRNSTARLLQLLELYSNEKYVLMMNQNNPEFEVLVSFKVGATGLSVLRSLWQTYWLFEHTTSSENLFDHLARSLKVMETRFEDFLKQLLVAGWNTDDINIKIPGNILIDEFRNL